ncbi:hypothetical protein FD09_GL000889 [Schleiferilactobacillus perolens DSM 12744]|uniref:Uncharacterized protein n=2 Tax=Schleiferilactobacillus perolens TaxID=100468 RepID=A0A0R1N072_9LACO|nr:hypothetical protein FD09_GL000889 [Schleiferilactobacillus perolens DSM 12744]
MQYAANGADESLMVMINYECGDWVRYKDTSCRVLGHWHDKQWTDYLMLGVPESIGTFQGVKQVVRWKFVGTVLPDAVELIKRRPKNEAVEEG